MPNVIQRADGIRIETTEGGAWVSTSASGFTSKEDAMDWQLEFANSWPVWGYGTSFSVSEQDGSYTVTARRYPSCD